MSRSLLVWVENRRWVLVDGVARALRAPVPLKPRTAEYTCRELRDEHTLERSLNSPKGYGK
jgi:hypothetical protein